jgi:nucleotide-binding universal stress UspA family protein
MSTLLLPCDGSNHSLVAVRRVIDAVRDGGDHRIHLVNVQPHFNAHIARHLDRATRMDFHRERAEQALAGARELLDAAGVPYQVHLEIGDKPRCIAGLARRLGCDRIVLATARRNPLLRALVNSLTGRLLEHSTVPVEVIGAHRTGVLERMRVPAMCFR